MTMLGVRVGLIATIVATRHCKNTHARSFFPDMSETYSKLFLSITRSSIWLEDDQTLRVWVTMLALADRDGYVGASVGGLAAQARVPVAKTREALQKFLSPDPDSRSQEYEGRRIEVADRGWNLLNYKRFRDMRDEEARKEYERNRKRNQRGARVPDSPGMSRTVPQCPAMSAQAEAEAEAEAKAEAYQGDPSPLPPPGRTAAPAARAKQTKNRTRLPAEGTWSEEHASRLLAAGRKPSQEEEAFRAHHEAKGSLMASWAAARATWVLNAERGYGAPRNISSVGTKRPTADDNVRRQFDRAAALAASERGRALP